MSSKKIEGSGWDADDERDFGLDIECVSEVRVKRLAGTPEPIGSGAPFRVDAFEFSA